MDCHEHWHAALENYEDPDGFRLALNSLIQALRNVTWLLQKQKSQLPGFEVWYPRWQESVKNDPVMKWATKARNRIVKEADLELYSRARVRIETDWLRASEGTFDIPPSWKHEQILRMLTAKGVPALPEGEVSVSVQRRWVDRMLPERELLDACAEVYERIRSVILDAHEASGVSECDLKERSRPCVDADSAHPFSCNAFDGDVRTLHFDLATLNSYERRVVRVNAADYPELSEELTKTLKELRPEGDAIGVADGLVELAKLFLNQDGALIPAAWFFRGEQIIDLHLLNFTDQISKRLALSSVAEKLKLLNADGIAMLSEVWTATVSRGEAESGPIIPARHRDDRGEAIQVTAATADGRIRSLTTGFTREAGQFVFGDTEVRNDAGFDAFLIKVFKVWGIDKDHLRRARQESSADSQEPTE